MVTGLCLALLLGPGAEAPPSTDSADPPQPEASAEDQAAWGAAGWGSPAPAEPDDPSPDDPSPDDPSPDDPTPDDPTPDDGASDDPDASAWGAAGWGDPPAATDDAGPVEGPREAEPAQDDWSAWDQSSTEAAAAPTSTSKKKIKAGDILAGSLRLTGSFLHYYDPLELPSDEVLVLTDMGLVPFEPGLLTNLEGESYPVFAVVPKPGDDALVLTVARLLVEADAGEHVHLSFNGFGELARVPAGATAGGTFASAGATASAYRTDYLRVSFWDNGSIAGQLGVDRASMRLSFKSVNIDVGRFPITYTVASLFTINDFFSPFSATAVNRIYKPGVDGARVSVGLGPTASVDVAGVLGYERPPLAGSIAAEDESLTSYYNGAPTWARSAVFAHASIVGAGYEWAALGGKLAQRWVAGGSLQGDAGPLNLRAEFHVGIPDEDGDGHDPDPAGDDDRPIYGRVSAGPSVTFAWKNANIMAEYMFASDGASGPSGYFERAISAYSDDLPYLGQHYVGVAGGSEIIPILRWSVTALVSATDGSGLAGVSLMYNVANESDLILGVFVPWGKPSSLDLLAGEFEFGSEFGLAPLSAYLEARVFF